MSAIRITAKRQATLPKALCEEMRVRSGDSLEVEPLVLEGRQVWVLRPARRERPAWFGSLRSFARRKDHRLTAIRASMERARLRGRAP